MLIGTPLLKESKSSSGTGGVPGIDALRKARINAVPVARALPSETTSFFGRDAELMRLRELFDSGRRLVTLVGAPGIGKTRLALAFARLWSVENPVLCCDLTEATSRDRLFNCLAYDCGLAPDSSRRLLADGPLPLAADTLVVFDNFESAIESGAHDLARWLQSSPRLNMLVTSRERLRLREECTFELEGLSPSAAFDLFVDRAQAAHSAWSPSAESRTAIAAIVEYLESLPLAIELAAARMGTLSPKQLLSRLLHRADLLVSVARNVTPSRTLERAIEDSVAQLGPAEQELLVQCTVFRGGFSIEAAEAVLLYSADATSASLYDGLQLLRDKSLLRRLESGPDVEPRYAMFVAIRDVAERRWATGDSRQAVEARHARYFADLAQRVAHHEDGVENLDAERANLLVVVERAVTLARDGATEPCGDAFERAVGIVLAMGELLSNTGPPDEQLRVVDDAVHMAKRALGDSPSLAQLLELRAVIVRGAGDLYQSRVLLEQALDMACHSDDFRTVGSVENRLGLLAQDEQDLQSARAHFERALEWCRKLKQRVEEAHTLCNLGGLAQEEGRFDRAEAHYREGLAVGERSRNIAVVGSSLAHIAALEHEAEHWSQARILYDRALRFLAKTANRRLFGAVLAPYGAVLASLDEVEASEGVFQRAREVLSAVGDPRLIQVVDVYCGLLDLARERAETDPDLAAAHRVRATNCLARAFEPHLDGQLDRSLVERSDDARFAARLLAKALGAITTLTGDRVLLLGPDGLSFAFGGPCVDLRRRTALSLLLQALVTARNEQPGTPVSRAALLTAAWPGQRVLTESGASRVYVAISTLRKMGLRDAILRQGEGYLIDPELPIRIDSTCGRS